MTSLADEFPKALERARDLRSQYESLRGMPGVNVEFALGHVNQTIRAADAAAASGDVIEMIRAYEALNSLR